MYDTDDLFIQGIVVENKNDIANACFIEGTIISDHVKNVRNGALVRYN